MEAAYEEQLTATVAPTENAAYMSVPLGGEVADAIRKNAYTLGADTDDARWSPFPPGADLAGYVADGRVLFHRALVVHTVSILVEARVADGDRSADWRAEKAASVVWVEAVRVAAEKRLSTTLAARTALLSDLVATHAGASSDIEACTESARTAMRAYKKSVRAAATAAACAIAVARHGYVNAVVALGFPYGAATAPVCCAQR